jgi:hypothetical protein
VKTDVRELPKPEVPFVGFDGGGEFVVPVVLVTEAGFVAEGQIGRACGVERQELELLPPGAGPVLQISEIGVILDIPQRRNGRWPGRIPGVLGLGTRDRQQ